ncbi:hypothetical protein [Bacteriovorax sp. Seq25_V]|uniref:hypothetical protein n=1 Tax=Bacteriovorax sp. Seq25_V TaxID=1201288 RepID=UPI00038A5052|nr:hypothetical protein [Bacteriovorax sp. Seq25_V]EQC44342.1 hypothetical protein M900_A0401 [Bacteriovorax sp. Seq25_V]
MSKVYLTILFSLRTFAAVDYYQAHGDLDYKKEIEMQIETDYDSPVTQADVINIIPEARTPAQEDAMKVHDIVESRSEMLRDYSE